MTDIHDQLIVQRFTAVAESFATAPQFTDQQSLDALAELADATRRNRSLDVACGAGVVACHFARRVQRATGIDMTPAMLEQARQRQARMALANVTWDLGDVNALPYADSSFSIVTSRYAIHHMLEPVKVLRQMARVCAPDGRIVVADICLPADPVEADLFNRIERMNDPSHAMALTDVQWANALANAGLDLVPMIRYRLEFPLVRMLAAAGHSRTAIDRVHDEAKQAVRDGRLRASRLVDDQCLFGYPIAVFAPASRPSTN